MTPRNGDASQGASFDHEGFQYSETIADGENGDTVIIPPLGPGGGDVKCLLIAGANTGKFQFSLSSDAELKAGTETWVDWDLGDSTGNVSDSIKSPTALRGVSVSGEIKIYMVI